MEVQAAIMHDKTATLAVEVVYACEDQQMIFSLQAPAPCTVAEAIQLSGVLMRYPDIDLSQVVVGIFSKKVALSTLVAAGDRIEIYRPLQQDPKSRRRSKLGTRKKG